jgi:hypothetical protein
MALSVQAETLGSDANACTNPRLRARGAPFDTRACVGISPKFERGNDDSDSDINISFSMVFCHPFRFTVS